jgi:hypothetical protein
MRRKIRKISRVVPPVIDGEPPSDPPGLNPTASWYSGDAWLLFAEIVGRCDLPTAKFIFQKCILVAEEQESRAATVTREKAARLARALPKLPTLEQITLADRQQVSRWWARLPDRRFNAQEKRVIAALTLRYQQLGGYPRGFNENLPPIKKRGSIKRAAPNADLPALFDEANPKSAFSIEKARRGGKLTKRSFAAILTPRYGETAEHVLANLRYRQRAKI